ncbi:phytoene/squalene synthase family protein [Phaeovibrio sulfidiphilus]|uniref:Phytoene/squalene synthase family protein n=2 Tax=Phaeovibrio sulfidiphilus TaxID=1220600 RepID=A0A8J6YVG1_9PROT|nr:phytoene/squalene synthase family protein [Phaeovibrio sulfidiphilus]
MPLARPQPPRRATVADTLPRSAAKPRETSFPRPCDAVSDLVRPLLEKPEADIRPSGFQTDSDFCRETIKGGSLTFHAASLFLPRDRRDPCYALYAFCRLADDAVDCEPDAERKKAACQLLRKRLDAAYDGRPWDTPIDRAFSDMVRAYRMPKALPEALIEGMEWDADERRYETLSDLKAYAARVAAVVGAMMTVLMGVRYERTLSRACDLGVAMQLTNICRDVGEDAREGRLFLPLSWLREEGLDVDAWMADPVFCPEVAAVVKRLLDEADRLYERAYSGIHGLPGVCRCSIQAAGMLYQAIGHKVVERDYDSISSRAWVSTGEKLVIASKAFFSSLVPRFADRAPALPETAFLVDAVVNAPEPVRRADEAPGERVLPRPSRTPWWRLGLRVAWTLEMLMHIDERSHAPQLYHPHPRLSGSGAPGAAKPEPAPLQ